MTQPKSPPQPPASATWTATQSIREATGFADDDRVALGLRAGPWALLKRLTPQDPAEPVGLVVAGTISRTPVPDVLSLVHSIGQEGELVFSFPDATKRLYLRSGNIVFASSTLLDDRLGEMLMSKGRLDRGTFDSASKETSSSKKFGRVLIERGILSAHDLYDAVRDQIESIVHSLFTYTDGTFFFSAHPIVLSNPIRLPHPMAHYILEGVRRNDELRQSLESVNDRLVVLRKTEVPLEEAHAEGHPGMLRDVLALVDGIAPVWQIIARSTWSEVNTVLALARLLRAGTVERVPLSETRDVAAPAPQVPPEQQVADVSAFLRDLSAAIRRAGGDVSALAEYFDAVKPDFRGIWAGVMLQPDGGIDGRIVAYNVKRSGDPAEAGKLLRAGLQDLLEFALWVAADQLPYEEATRLVGSAARLRETSG